MIYIRFLFFIILASPMFGQLFKDSEKKYTRQDSLRGTNNAYRDWWDVKQYDIELEPFFEEKRIKGQIVIEFDILKEPIKPILQIDLQQPMRIVEMYANGVKLKNTSKREGNVYFLDLKGQTLKKVQNKLRLVFEGKPKIANNPPWDGGWIFTHDEKGRPWMSVACQGLGASVWYPNKDYLGDEPDRGATFTIKTTDKMVAVGNGRLIKKKKNSYTWKIINPINNYDIIPYIGYYVNFKDEFQGEKGVLDLDYWVLDYNIEKAKKHFKQVKPMLKSFENWFGAYPFYEDSYKLVESPYLGMEHQSNIAYGNKFQNGYLGEDLSGTGWGLKWDFIIVHESGHEWYGNSITNKDVADMWIHESFTAYSETLYVESQFGKEAANIYVIGTRQGILNDQPIIGAYGVNKEGSSDMYYKGANMLHTIRQFTTDTEFREMLRGMNNTFYHQTVTTKQIENYINKTLGKNFTALFDQYLRTVDIPILEYSIKNDVVSYRWANVVSGFEMPLRIKSSKEWIYPTTEWKKSYLSELNRKELSIDPNFYIKTKRIEQ